METRQWQDKLNLSPLRKSNLPNPRKRITFSMMASLELLIKSSGSKIWQFRYIRPVTKKRAKQSIGPTRQLRLLMPEPIEQSLAFSWRNKPIHRNISKNNFAVRWKPKLILFNSWQNVGGT